MNNDKGAIMKNKIFALVLIPFLLTACSNTSSTTIDTSESNNSSTEQVSVSESISTEDRILFFGEYVIDGEIPSTGYVYDRMIFFPDGKCYAHYYINGEAKDYYSSYDYSYCSQSEYIGFARENGSIMEIPSMSEHRTLLKFENYVLKRVDEQ
jgi:hypothetical protein